MLKFLLSAQKAQTLTASSIPLPSPLPSPRRTHSASLQVITHYKTNMGNPLSCHWYIGKPIAFYVHRASFSSIHYKAACRQSFGFFCPHAKTEPCRCRELGTVTFAMTSLLCFLHFPSFPAHTFPATPQFHMVLEYPAEPEPHFWSEPQLYHLALKPSLVSSTLKVP